MGMMPIILPPGMVSLYGLGTATGVSGLVPGDTRYKFASIYDVSNGGDINVYPGQPVIFNEQERAYVLFWNNQPFTIIEANKLGGVELVQILP